MSDSRMTQLCVLLRSVRSPVLRHISCHSLQRRCFAAFCACIASQRLHSQPLLPHRSSPTRPLRSPGSFAAGPCRCVGLAGARPLRAEGRSHGMPRSPSPDSLQAEHQERPSSSPLRSLAPARRWVSWEPQQMHGCGAPLGVMFWSAWGCYACEACEGCICMGCDGAAE